MSIKRKKLRTMAKQEVDKIINEGKMLIIEQPEQPPMAQQLSPVVQDALAQVQQLFAQGQQAAEISNAMVGSADMTQQALMQVMTMLQQQQEMEAQQAQEQAKAEKHQSRTTTQVVENNILDPESFIKAVRDSAAIEEAFRSTNLDRVYKVEIKVVIDREINFKDLFNSIRAIEGVTVVSTDADSQNISPTLQRGLLSIKFLKGARSAEYYLRLLNQAIKRLKGIKSTSLGKVSLVRDA